MLGCAATGRTYGNLQYVIFRNYPYKTTLQFINSDKIVSCTKNGVTILQAGITARSFICNQIFTEREV